MSALRTGLLGKKLGMTQVFTPQGDLRSVTAIHAGPNVVVGLRTQEKDGYTAVRLGYGTKPLRLTKRPELGVFKKAGLDPPRVVREIRMTGSDLSKFEVGKVIPIDSVFKTGTYVDVNGTSKGKGFQGVMKRHHMSGFRASHGTHEFFRHGGHRTGQAQPVGNLLRPNVRHRGRASQDRGQSEPVRPRVRRNSEFVHEGVARRAHYFVLTPLPPSSMM